MIFTVFACKSNIEKNTEITESEISESVVNNNNTSISGSSSENENSSSKNPSNNKNNNSSKPKDNSSATQKPLVEDKINTDDEIKQPEAPKIEEIKHSYGNHKFVSESEYYQFNTLAGNKKSLYLEINKAVKNSQNVVNISNLNLKKEAVVEVYTKFLADYPQYFFISKSYFIINNSKGTKVRALVILYTDGDVTDDFDDYMNFTTIADRNKINQKITEVNTSVSEIVSRIPDDITDAQKEKIIYDYVINLIDYDYDFSGDDEAPILNTHVYDIYGALIKKRSVCEGYAELFQYLCYNVGINSSQVFGYSEGDTHAWNVVKIEDEWYHVDLTWADEVDYVSYTYYNLTTDQILETHTIRDYELSIPECNSTKNSFMNLFVIYVENTNSAPNDYKTAIDNLKAINNKEIYIYVENYYKDRFGNVNTDRYVRYIQKYFSKGTEISNYLASLGIELNSNIYANNEYIAMGLKGI